MVPVSLTVSLLFLLVTVALTATLNVIWWLYWWLAARTALLLRVPLGPLLRLLRLLPVHLPFGLRFVWYSTSCLVSSLAIRSFALPVTPSAASFAAVCLLLSMYVAWLYWPYSTACKLFCSSAFRSSVYSSSHCSVYLAVLSVHYSVCCFVCSASHRSCYSIGSSLLFLRLPLPLRLLRRRFSACWFVFYSVCLSFCPRLDPPLRLLSV